MKPTIASAWVVVSDCDVTVNVCAPPSETVASTRVGTSVANVSTRTSGARAFGASPIAGAVVNCTA